MLNKNIILSISLFLAVFVMIKPLQTNAFEIGQLIDPLCIWACEDEEDSSVINSYNTNSFNTNNTTNTTVVPTRDEVRKPSNTNTIINRPVYIDNTPLYTSYNYPTNQPTYSQLGISCYPLSTTGNVGDTISWRASPYGGNGNYYITWSGADGLSGYGNNTSKIYNNAGSKYASVTVTSGNQTVSQNCGTNVQIYDYNYSNNNNYNYNYNYDYNNYYNNNYYNNTPLYVSCYSNTTYSPVETRITWIASVSGGNGYYNYNWSGTDYLSGYTKNLDVIYHSLGIKTASVTVYSGNQTITKTCSNSVNITNQNYQYYSNPYLVYNPIVNNNGILVACYSNKTSTKIGSSIVWSAEATGATGNFTYTWSGSEGLSGNQSSIPKIYYTSGIKNASVIATASNGQSIVQQCSNTVNVLNNTKTPAKASVSNTPTPTPESNSISNSLIALKNVPWILVSILVILVLMFTVIYLIFNRNKI